MSGLRKAPPGWRWQMKIFSRKAAETQRKRVIGFLILKTLRLCGFARVILRWLGKRRGFPASWRWLRNRGPRFHGHPARSASVWPSRSGRSPWRRITPAAEFLRLRVHVVHELVDQGDGDLFDLGLGVGDFSDKNVAGGIDAAFGIGVEQTIIL